MARLSSRLEQVRPILKMIAKRQEIVKERVEVRRRTTTDKGGGGASKLVGSAEAPACCAAWCHGVIRWRSCRRTRAG